MRPSVRPDPAGPPTPAGKSAAKRISPVAVLLFMLPSSLGFAVFAAEYALLPVPAVLAFYKHHSGIIDATSIGAVYHSTGNPLYLYYAVYAASLPAIFVVSAAVLVPRVVRYQAGSFEAPRLDKTILPGAILFTIGTAGVYFALPETYTGMKFHFSKYDWIRFWPNLAGAFVFAFLFWLPAIGWTLLLAAGAGRLVRRINHLLWKRDSRKRQQDRQRRYAAAGRTLPRPRGHDGEGPAGG